MTRLFSRWLRCGLGALALLLATVGVAQAHPPAAALACKGYPETHSVPAGAARLQVIAVGGSGAQSNCSYGLGARAQAIITVVPGEALSVVVGGSGSAAGGYNGGGRGDYGGGGGGATDLRRPTASTDDYLTTRQALLVAGGGAGSIANTIAGGGTGGTPQGGDGRQGGYRGYGASQAGVGIGATSGSAGTNGTGGTGTTCGGGGGYYGGGGGGVVMNGVAYGGGGGGSSWVAPSSLVGSVTYSLASAAGNGSLAITPLYTPTPTLTNFNPASGPVGTQVTLTGTNLSGATSVRFGELTAPSGSFTVNATGTSLTVTVPLLAATNAVSVTTPGGVAVSTTRFLVTRASTASHFISQGLLSINRAAAFGPLSPVVTDLDGDGLLDLLVGDLDGFVERFEQPTANATSFANLGYLQADGAALSLSRNGNYAYAVPTVTDLDGDGLLDLLVGSESGYVQRYEQSGRNAASFTNLGNLQAGSGPLYVTNLGNAYSTPTVTDLDGNGLLDLLVGNRDGIVRRFEQSSANAATFNDLGNLQADGTTLSLLALDSRYSAPTVTDLDGNGLLDLLVGSDTKGILRYEQSGPNAVSFTSQGRLQADGTALSAGYYYHTKPVVTDLDGNGLLDLLTGNNQGQIMRHEQVPPAPVLTSLSPTSAPVGTSITLTGTNLSTTTAVRFNGTAATTFTVVDATTITATVPAGATTGPVTVTTLGGTSDGVAFAVTSAPIVTTATPTNIKTTSAVLGGAISSDGGVTGYRFGILYVLGTGTPTLSNTLSNTLDEALNGYYNGSNPISFHAVVSGLTPGTTYTVRAYATNSVGTNYGSAISFTTVCPAPIFTQAPASQTVAADADQCTASVRFQATASGEPAPAIVYTVNGTPITSPYAFALGTTTVTATATNSCGNTASKTFTVTVQDQQAPTVRTQNLSVSLVNGTATITGAQVNGGSSDNCSATLTYRVSPSTFSCDNIGANPVTLTVTDASGNQATGMATVTVLGTIPTPTIAVTPATNAYTGGVPTTLYLGYGPQSVTLTASGGGSYQWSPTAGLSNTSIANPVFTATQAGSFTYTVTATSASGCSGTASVTLTVVDARCSSGKSGKLDKVLVCHKGNTLCISADDVADHLGHGDLLGTCLTSPAQPASLARLAAAPDAPSEATTSLDAYPNPFTRSTILRFQAAQAGSGQLQIYNALGQLVATLYHGPVQSGEVVERTLDGTTLGAGLYTCRFTTTSGEHLTRRVVLTK